VAQSPYAATKSALNQLAFELLSFVRYASVRGAPPFNTVRSRQSERAIIPTIVSQALRNAEPLTLGSLSRDVTSSIVTDTVRGFLVLAERRRQSVEP